MKSCTFAIIGILLAVVAKAHSDPEVTGETRDAVKGIIRSCSARISDENLIKMIQENDEHAMSIEAKCFAACALSHVGLMKNGKMHVNQIEDKLSSMMDTIRLCAKEANENANECVVVGKFGECLMENDL